VPRFWSKGVDITEKVAEVVYVPRSGAGGGGGGGDGEVVLIYDAGSSGFGYEFRALGSPSINDSSNTEESPAPS